MNIGAVHSSLATIQGYPQTAGSPQSDQLATSQATAPTATAVAGSASSGADQRSAAELIVSRSNDPLRPDRLQPSADRTASSGASQQNSSPSSQTPSSPSTPPQSQPDPAAAAAPASSIQSAQLDPQQQAQLRELAQIDRDVRDHEAAHAAAGGSLAGAPSYSYTRGPDGQLYATGGEVSIDTSASVDPKDAAQNARTVLQAALAPANPSTQDLRVAAQARAQLIDAQAELTRNEQQAVEEQRSAKAEPSGVEAEPESESVLSQTLKAEKEAEEEAKANGQQRDDDRGSSFQDNRTALQAREARIRQSQLDFAEELSALNQRIQQVQQQLIETGEVDPASLLQGSLLDTQA